MTDVDYADFETRLSQYGISLDEVRGTHLFFGGRTAATLSLSGSVGTAPTHVLRTSDLDELKRWIGFDDAQVESGEIELSEASQALANVQLGTGAAEGGDEFQLAQLARAYVFGNSATVSQHKDLLEERLGPFNVAVQAAETITIQPGQPYVVDGSTPVVIAADTMTFEGSTAQFISYAPLKLDVGKLVMQS